jgi:hypothetical protein
MVLSPLSHLIGQIVLDEEPRRLYYERLGRVRKFKDMKDFRDVFHYNKLLLGKRRISGNISYNTGRVVITDQNSKHDEYRKALGFYTRIRFFEEFSLNSTFYKDFNPKATARWISDFTYSFGRYSWRPNTFNYGYENYENNKYSDNSKTRKEKFLRGYYFISYQHYLPDNLFWRIRIDSTSMIKFIYFARYSVKYENKYHQVNENISFGKPVAGVAIRYVIARNIFVEGAAYYYFYPYVIRQQVWDPDYSYGFGYFDWRSFRVSLTYGNWAINRFPWNKTAYPWYGFLDGNFKVTLNYIW